ncbi:MAG: 50S ribosomal protein L16 [Candidatus Yanofskybacteria bacterium RIFCSPHIGHO2_02_FULL_43_15c]|uniref:Large ribosomal subunit protein uL16 n=2 Tax=Candidatus Yanofskyibacteriota TaxID=1752733 RepID=A0A1F8GZF3_9BACT|nr:MAG: 50S ribosomal protein L16 [Candidatus Yanofskybacteria bacterium RIFCSPHIGHO2_02_FULL_43_15c]OGN30754.1 MAG: 50S ribosomal protein L16 [Candidatus Yanofskybacteria bacterium RIFCSPLOWO2_02_FULL_43_10b]
MLQPKRIKHRKVHVGRLQAKTSRGFSLSFGSYGLKSLESSFINAGQIESARRTMTRFIQRGGKIWIRVFPDKPMTAKPPEVGMGGGAGALKEFVAAVSAGRILFEMDGVAEDIAKEAFRLAAFKLPVKTKFIKR